jgi:hypothetical protein
MAEKLIELLSPKGFAHPVPLCSHGIQPHFAVSRVLHCRSVSMVRVDVSQLDKGFSDRYQLGNGDLSDTRAFQS